MALVGGGSLAALIFAMIVFLNNPFWGGGEISDLWTPPNKYVLADAQCVAGWNRAPAAAPATWESALVIRDRGQCVVATGKVAFRLTAGRWTPAQFSVKGWDFNARLMETGQLED